jgi:hypothetical protein
MPKCFSSCHENYNYLMSKTLLAAGIIPGAIHLGQITNGRGASLLLYPARRRIIRLLMSVTDACRYRRRQAPLDLHQ